MRESTVKESLTVQKERRTGIVPAGRAEKIVDNALVALTLMIVESKPEEKDTVSKVVVNLINLKN